MNQKSEPERDVRTGAPRRIYTTPTLTIFGGVASLTGNQSMTGANMDGGPNNSKT